MTIEWPAGILPTRPYRFTFLTNTASSISPFTRARRDEERPGAHWAMSAHFGPMPRDEARRLRAFLLGLDGPVGRVMVPDFSYEGQLGRASGPMTLTGAAGAKSVTVANVGGIAPHFLAGDRLEVAERLHEIVADAMASGGTATLSIRPPLREAVAGVRIDMARPRCRMQLPDDAQVAIDALSGPVREITLQLVEALP
jgi:hypothetical protein